jgi:hypothetical protein
LDVKSNRPLWRNGALHQSVENIGDRFDLTVMQSHGFGELRQLFDQLARRSHEATESNKDTDNLNVDPHSGWRFEDAGEHGDAVFRECQREFAVATVPGT